MSRNEEFRQHILDIAPAGDAPHGSHVCIRASEESHKFTIAEPHIVQLTVEMWRSGLVSLNIWDGQRECPLEDWISRGGTADSFFHNRTDSGYVRVRLLAAGDEEKERLGREPIGFAAR